MKKFISLLFCAAILLSLCTAVGALAYKPNSEVCNVSFELKKTQPSAVVKDGMINVAGGEYERLSIGVDPDSLSTDLSLGYGSDKMFEKAYNMCATMEYYFSWDESHGFNFAVRYKPHEVKQELEEGISMPPQDDFARQVAVNFVSYTDIVRPDEYMDKMLYYTVAKSTLTGEYMRGHWGQLGVTGHYSPTPKEDFVIYYENSGYVVCEWSVPFDKLGVKADDGEKVYFSVSATAGDDLEGCGNLFTTAYAISLGDYGFMTKMSGDKQMATAVISSEMLSAETETDADSEVPKETSAQGTSADPESRPDTSVGSMSGILMPDITVDMTYSAGESSPPIESSADFEGLPSETNFESDNPDVLPETEENDKKESVESEGLTLQGPGNENVQGAPQTGDFGVVAIAVSAAVSLCGVCFAKRKR